MTFFLVSVKTCQIVKKRYAVSWVPSSQWVSKCHGFYSSSLFNPTLCGDIMIVRTRKTKLWSLWDMDTKRIWKKLKKMPGIFETWSINMISVQKYSKVGCPKSGGFKNKTWQLLHLAQNWLLAKRSVINWNPSCTLSSKPKCKIHINKICKLIIPLISRSLSHIFH